MAGSASAVLPALHLTSHHRLDPELDGSPRLAHAPADWRWGLQSSLEVLACQHKKLRSLVAVRAWKDVL